MFQHEEKLKEYYSENHMTSTCILHLLLHTISYLLHICSSIYPSIHIEVHLIFGVFPSKCKDQCIYLTVLQCACIN